MAAAHVLMVERVVVHAHVHVARLEGPDHQAGYRADGSWSDFLWLPEIIGLILSDTTSEGGRG
jgi:hypothetical protein